MARLIIPTIASDTVMKMMYQASKHHKYQVCISPMTCSQVDGAAVFLLQNRKKENKLREAKKCAEGQDPVNKESPTLK